MEYSCFYWGVFRSAVVKAKYTHTQAHIKNERNREKR